MRALLSGGTEIEVVCWLDDNQPPSLGVPQEPSHQLPEHPGDKPPLVVEQPGPSLEDLARLLENHGAVLIQEIHRELQTRVPGGFQAERLVEMLE